MLLFTSKIISFTTNTKKRHVLSSIYFSSFFFHRSHLPIPQFIHSTINEILRSPSFTWFFEPITLFPIHFFSYCFFTSILLRSLFLFLFLLGTTIESIAIHDVTKVHACLFPITFKPFYSTQFF